MSISIQIAIANMFKKSSNKLCEFPLIVHSLKFTKKTFRFVILKFLDMKMRKREKKILKTLSKLRLKNKKNYLHIELG